MVKPPCLLFHILIPVPERGNPFTTHLKTTRPPLRRPPHRHHCSQLTASSTWGFLFFSFLFFETESRCRPGWSAVARSRLTASSAPQGSRHSPASASRVAGTTGACLSFKATREEGKRMHGLGSLFSLLLSTPPLICLPCCHREIFLKDKYRPCIIPVKTRRLLAALKVSSKLLLKACEVLSSPCLPLQFTSRVYPTCSHFANYCRLRQGVF